MAKRYIRVNSGQGWENAPSVATPINKSNLNIMDKGIDDLDLYKIDTDAIVNNGVTTVAGTVLDGRMGKALQDQVTTINNNLAGLKKINGIVRGNGITTITHGVSSFAFLINIQGGGNPLWGSYIYQGYGSGTTLRDHYITLGSGTNLTVEIVDNTLVITNTNSVTASMSITILMGDLPTIS